MALIAMSVITAFQYLSKSWDQQLPALSDNILEPGASKLTRCMDFPINGCGLRVNAVPELSILLAIFHYALRLRVTDRQAVLDETVASHHHG